MARRYDYPHTSDPLVALAATRQSLIANKRRDFAGEIESRKPWTTWPAKTNRDARSLATGEPVTMLSREDFNAQRRAHEERFSLRHRYEAARRRAVSA